MAFLQSFRASIPLVAVFCSDDRGGSESLQKGVPYVSRPRDRSALVSIQQRRPDR